MEVTKKIDMYVAETNKQVDATIATTYTDEELLAKFRRIPTDDILFVELLARGLADDPTVRALAGDKLIQVERGETEDEPAPDEFELVDEAFKKMPSSLMVSRPKGKKGGFVTAMRKADAKAKKSRIECMKLNAQNVGLMILNQLDIKENK
jgi:hypothetical protein